MRALFFAAEILLLLASLKSLLFWVYLWQVKEYRLGRFWAEYGSVKKLLRFWLGAGGKALKKPRFTAKATLMALIAFFPIFSVFGPSLFFLLPPFPVLPTRFYLAFLRFSIGMYLAVPVIVSLLAIVFKAPTYIAKEVLYRRAARKRREMKDLTVIGITGSYGKSSTKEFLAHILSRKFNVLKTPANVNTEAGIARFMLDYLLPRHQVFVAEIGAYRRGEIKKAARFLGPKIGILTGISEQHMALFGSLENTKRAKFELIESLPEDGFALFNGENPHTAALFEKWPGKKALYHASSLRPDLPRHYRLNLGAAVEAARYLGLNEEEISQTVEKLEPDERMISAFFGKSGAYVINDGYSENPDGVCAALDMLRDTKRNKKIVIMPCIIELGKAAPAVHHRIGAKIREIGATGIVTTPDNFDDIKRGTGGMARLISNPAKVIEAIKSDLGPDTAVLLEGRLPHIISDYDF